jgi:4-carboxymuconolactone decarboxylase
VELGLPGGTEAGVPDTSEVSWAGIVAPAHTPDEIVKNLEREIVRIARLPDIQERLRLVETCEQGLGNMIRLKSKLEWSAPFEWFAREPYGHEFGFEADVIEAIRTGRVPVFKHEEEKVVYDIIHDLQAQHSLSQTSFDRAHAKLGLQPLIELIAGAGYATMLAMTLRSFEVPAPDGEQPLPAIG